MIEFKTDSCVNCFNCNVTLLMKKKRRRMKKAMYVSNMVFYMEYKYPNKIFSTFQN